MLLFDNPTQATGAVAFLAAFICCLLPGRTGGWPLLAGIYLGLAAEMFFEARHGIRLITNDFLQQGGIYTGRAGYQLAITGLAGLVVLLGIFRARRSQWWIHATLPARWAWIASMALLGLFAVELLSVHAIDAILYQQTGGIMLIAWAWLLGAGTTAGTAIVTARISKTTASSQDIDG